MKFVFPCKEYEQKAVEYIQEFRDNASETNGTGGLNKFLRESTYDDWLIKIRRDVDIANMTENQVPRLTYFYVRDDDKIIGMINIRLTINSFWKDEGGHFGYSIRPTERGKGYCTKMLSEALVFCRKIGLNNFIIVCNKSNPASAGVIKNCGGVLDAEFYSDEYEAILQRFIIR